MAPQCAASTSDTTYDLLLQAFNGPLTSILSSPSIKYVHDNASGHGTASSALLTFFAAHPNLPIPTIEATDYILDVIRCLEGIIDERVTAGNESWANVNATIDDSQNLCFADEIFDLSITNFSIANFESVPKALSEVYRTLKPSATTIVTDWKTFGFAGVIGVAMKKVTENPAPPAVAGTEFRKREVLVSSLVEAGFEESGIEVFETKVVVGDEESLKGAVEFLTGPFWAPMLGNLNVEEREKWPVAVNEAVKEVQQKDGGIVYEAWVLAAKK